MAERTFAIKEGMMFAVNQRIVIQSTEDLPTIKDGETGVITHQWNRFKEFYTVLLNRGTTEVFHKSQLRADICRNISQGITNET